MLKTCFIPVHLSFQFSHTACARGVAQPMLPSSRFAGKHWKHPSSCCSVSTSGAVEKTYLQRNWNCSTLEEWCGCSLPEQHVMHRRVGPCDGCCCLPCRGRRRWAWGQAWYLPLCLLALRCVTAYGCAASYHVILYTPLCVGAARGFPCLGGETLLREEIPLRVASSAGEQQHPGTKPPLFCGSTETANICALGQL